MKNILKMKNSTLIFRSLAVIIFIAGSAHLISYASQNTNYNYQEPIRFDKIDKTNNEVEIQSTNKKINPEINYIVGKWKVTYNTDDFKGAIVYDIKKQGNIFNAYTYQYQDKNGNSLKAENSKTLTIKKFDGYKGKGIYEIEYEKQKYQVECEIDMVDENTFKLSYDYYGYSDVETWKRQ